MSQFDWQSLPKTLKLPLLHGASGKHQLMHIAQVSLRRIASSTRAQASQYLQLAQQVLFHVWSEEPVDGYVAGQLLDLHAHCPFLPSALLPALRTVIKHWKPGEHDRYLQRLLQKKDTERLRNHLDLLLSREPDNLYCRMHSLDFGLLFNELEWLLDHVRQPWTLPLEPIRQATLARLELLKGNTDKAGNALALARKVLPGTLALTRAELLVRQGFQDKATAVWARQADKHPWMTNTILKLHDTLNPAATTPCLPSGRIALCLYTWNKAAEIDLTLSSLLDSTIGEARVFVLDNGSTDQTPQVLHAWRERFGKDRLEIVTLPVNIGAPAARNWLMHLPEIRAADWIAYLDDDLNLPADWLVMLGAAATAYPSAGSWGCRVVDDQAPHLLQSVDYHLKAPGLDGYGHETTVSLSDMHFSTFDQGQFSYLRPCLHVTGCCHLFAAETLFSCGDFDLRFSPSQFDDLDHDIRSCLARKPAVYQGHLAVRHMMHTGKLSQKKPDQIGAMLGNLHKLQHKYSEEEFDWLVDWETALLEKDLLDKISWLAGTRDWRTCASGM